MRIAASIRWWLMHVGLVTLGWLWTQDGVQWAGNLLCFVFPVMTLIQCGAALMHDVRVEWRKVGPPVPVGVHSAVSLAFAFALAAFGHFILASLMVARLLFYVVTFHAAWNDQKEDPR